MRLVRRLHRGLGAGVERDGGYSTVLAVGLILVILTMGGLVATLGGITVARHRAEATADLAALAVAKHALEGQDGACAAARRLVAKQGATLLECRLDGLDAVVVVAVVPPGRAAAFGLVRGRARAGRR
jgi:secretion/DNA translocation related TadE-like protein